MYKMRQVGLCLMVLCFFSTGAKGQLDSFRYRFIETLSRDINKFYVSEKLARQMTDSIRSIFVNGDYDSTLNADEFAFEVTQDLRRISKDNHLAVTPLHYDYVEDSLIAAKKLDDLSPKQRKKLFTKNKEAEKKFHEEYRKRTRDDMFTYGDIKILPGEIGYVEILNFESTSFIKGESKNRIAIASVFNYLRNTSSIIVDLRENQGGLTRLAAKFCSYFSEQPNAYFITTEDFIRYDSSGAEKEFSVIKRYYTETSITAGSLNKKAIYLLVSNKTFSAAELVAYKIKQFMPSALIIGEQTKGGGNGFSGRVYSPYYEATIPSGKTFDENNAGYNIEGKGITPDIFTTADSALDLAYRLAYKNNANVAAPEVKNLNRRKIFKDKPEFKKYFPDYVGNYRKVNVYKDNGKLYMIYDTFKKYLLSPVEMDFFLSEDFKFIRFVRNNNEVIEIQIKHQDEYLERFRKH